MCEIAKYASLTVPRLSELLRTVPFIIIVVGKKLPCPYVEVAEFNGLRIDIVRLFFLFSPR
jgi:hypothetical protein